MGKGNSNVEDAGVELEKLKRRLEALEEREREREAVDTRKLNRKNIDNQSERCKCTNFKVNSSGKKSEVEEKVTVEE